MVNYAGGFSEVDSTVEFYSRIQALMRPDMRVLDLGAGTGGSISNDPIPYRAKLRTLKGKAAHIIGADVDPEIKNNPYLDEAHTLRTPQDNLPIADQSVDMIVSDWTFEHVADPVSTAREIDRVLKPGGWICARTPNRWGYIGMAADLIPNGQHTRLLRYLQPKRKPESVYPTTYLMNTWTAFRRYFPQQVYSHHIYTTNSDPAYCGGVRFLESLLQWSFRLTPKRLGAIFHIFLQKKPAGSA